MKTATLPPLRVSPEFRKAAESVLKEGESLSAFVEESVRRQVAYRRNQQEFIARGLAAREEARQTGIYFTAEESLTALDAILEKHQPKPA